MKRLFASLLAAAALVSLPATASERRFTYVYESQVLNPGDAELEPWTTLRAGRDDYYMRYDLRLELEVGVVDRLQTAFYWNMTSVAEDVTDATGTDVREQSFAFTGVSNEWKYKLSDPLADVLGSALYFEATAGPVEAELEAKLILDKRVGDWLFAFNAVGEHEWEFEEEETEREIVIAPVIGAAYMITSRFSLGLEARAHIEIEDEYEHTALFAGPVAAYAGEGWWSALTLLPQLAAHESEDDEDDSALDLDHHERIELRWLLGVHL